MEKLQKKPAIGAWPIAGILPTAAGGYWRTVRVLPEYGIDRHQQANDDHRSGKETRVYLEHAAIHLEPVRHDTAFVFDDTDQQHANDAEYEHDAHAIDKRNLIDARGVGHGQADGIEWR